MKILERHLRDYIDLPSGARAVRDLLDDIGIEVKRIAPSQHGDVYTVELLANRGDHASYAGIAREVCGRTGSPIRLPAITELQVGDAPWEVRIESPACLRYSLTLLERVAAPSPLPATLRHIIEATGGHTVGPEVDATNLANLELGQPTHAFDADTIVGAVTVRAARAGETCLPLFQQTRVPVPEGALVIADDEKILAVAGVIGCDESKTTDATKRILLESATFEPVSVRKTARAMGIQTDSSARFERGSDPSMVIPGAGRVVYLLESSADYRRVGATALVGDWVNPNRILPVNIPAAGNFLVYPLSDSDVRERLTRYGFEVSPTWPMWSEEGWTTPDNLEDAWRSSLRHSVLVRVPAGRLWDVETSQDLYEELAKSIGYNATPETLPPVDKGGLPSDAERNKAIVEQVLVGNGFFEVFTDGFYGRVVRERLGITEGHPLWAHVETQNALERGYSLLKNNTLAQAIDTVDANLRVRNADIRAYEWTRTFHPDPTAENGVCRERKVLWAVGNARKETGNWSDREPSLVWLMSGLVEELGATLGLPLTVGEADPTAPLYGCLHPGRQGSVLLNGRRVGVLGEIHPTVVRNYKIKQDRPCYLEIDSDVLTSGRRPTFMEPDDVHPSVRSLAFTLPGTVRAGAIAEHMRRSGPPWLTHVDIVDLFSHVADGTPVRTVTFELTYSNQAAARSADEVNAASEYLIDAVAQRFGDAGVKLR